MARITVYTPTFNRAYTLERAYQALCRQTCKDFEWLIIDDGSTDNTKQIVEEWITEGKIPITYYYQDNSGVNVARNKAIELISTELNICVDSDDYLTDDAIELLITTWKNRTVLNSCGIIGYDVFQSGEYACDLFPESIGETTTLFELYEKYHCMGDKKMMYRTDLCKKYPCPVFPGEKYYPNRKKYYLIEREGPLIILRKPLCIVEYLPDGITASTYKRYMKNPVGLADYRLFLMDNDPSLKNIIRQSIHYVAMNIISKNGIGQKSTKHKISNILCAPMGFALYLYILFKNR